MTSWLNLKTKLLRLVSVKSYMMNFYLHLCLRRDPCHVTKHERPTSNTGERQKLITMLNNFKTTTTHCRLYKMTQGWSETGTRQEFKVFLQFFHTVKPQKICYPCMHMKRTCYNYNHLWWYKLHPCIWLPASKEDVILRIRNELSYKTGNWENNVHCSYCIL